MSKTPIERARHVLSGTTMGTRWSAQVCGAGIDPAPVQAALEAAVALVDAQMSTWKPDSDLMRVNRAAIGAWVTVPPALFAVLDAGLTIGQSSQGTFDIGLGDIVTAWGFGAGEADTDAIRATLGKPRAPSHEVLELDHATLRVRKHGALTLDLSGIAKGYAVDLMTQALRGFGITDALVGLDGELRALGSGPDGRGWGVAVERPDYNARAPLSMIALCDGAVATSGDYRHWVDLGATRLSHTISRVQGGPLTSSPASVTVLAPTCMMADAWATALMVAGPVWGESLIKGSGLTAIFVTRDGDDLRQTQIHGFAP